MISVTILEGEIFTYSNRKLLSDGRFRYFVSYSHKDSDIIDQFVEYFRLQHPEISFFYDKRSIDNGVMWLQEINDALENSDNVLVFIFPGYKGSRFVCLNSIVHIYYILIRQSL